MELFFHAPDIGDVAGDAEDAFLFADRDVARGKNGVPMLAILMPEPEFVVYDFAVGSQPLDESCPLVGNCPE